METSNRTNRVVGKRKMPEDNGTATILHKQQQNKATNFQRIFNKFDNKQISFVYNKDNLFWRFGFIEANCVTNALKIRWKRQTTTTTTHRQQQQMCNNKNYNNCMQVVALFLLLRSTGLRGERVEAYKRKWRVEILGLNADSSLIDGA